MDVPGTRKTILNRLRMTQTDQIAWDEFYKIYWKLVHSVALKAGLSHVDAQEVVQNTFIKVAKNIGKFEYDPRKGKFRNWLCLIAKQQAAGASHNRNIAPYLQEIATRRADPWCVLGFALVSAPLGLRRIRSSTGVSLGMAVLVFMPYYFVAFTLQVINKHGGISPEIPAWTGNILLYIVAASLILDKSR